MSKKRINNRLDKLFQEIKESESGTGEKPKETRASKPARPSRKAPKPDQVNITPTMSAGTTATLSLSPNTQPLPTLTQLDEKPHDPMSLVFRTGEHDWNMLQVVDETAERKWSSEEQLLVRQVVDQLTLALQNAQLFQQTRRQNADLAVLNALGRELASLLDTDQISQSVYQHIGQLMNVDNFFIALFNAEKQEVTYPLFVGNGQVQPVPVRKLGNALSDYVLRHNQTVFIPNNVVHYMQAMGIDFVPGGSNRMATCWLGVPMSQGGRVTGAIVVQSEEQENLYDEQHRDLLTAVAGQAAIAFQNAQLFRQTQQQTVELGVLNELGRELSALLSVEGVARTVHKYAGQLMDVTDYFMAIYHSENNEMSFPFAYFDNRVSVLERTNIGNGLTAYVIKNKQALYLPDNLRERMQGLGIEFVPIHEAELSQCWLGVPIVLGQEVLGAIVLQSTVTARLYTERHRDLLVAIANQAAIAIQNTRLYEQEQYRRQIADTLAEMARIAGSSLEVGQVVKSLLAQLPRLIDFNTASIQMIDADGRRRQVGGISLSENRQQDLASPPDQFLRPIQDDPLMNEVVISREPVFISDTYADPRWEVFPETKHIHSWLAAPLSASGNVIGILILDHTEANTYNTSAVDIIKAFSAQAAVAIQNADLYNQAEQRAAELGTLNEIVRAATQSINIEEIIETTYQKIRAIVKVDAFFMALYNEARKEVTFPVIYDEGVRYPASTSPLTPESSIGQAILTGESRLLLHSQEEYTRLLKEATVAGGIGNEQRPSASLVYIPIRLGERVIGALSVHSYELNAYNPQSMAFLQNVVNQLAVAIQNAELFEETRNRAVELTTLNQVGRAVSEQIGLEQVLAAAHAELKKALPVEGFVVALYDDTTDIISFPYVIDKGRRYENPPEKLNPETYSGKTIRSGQPTLDLLNQARYDTQLQAMPEVLGDVTEPARSILFVPLKLGARTIGAFSVQSYTFNAYDENTVKLMESVASQLSVAIANAQLFDQIRVSQARLSDALRVARMGYFEFSFAEQNFLFTDEFFELLGTSAEAESGYQVNYQDFLSTFVTVEYVPNVRAALNALVTSQELSGTLETQLIRRDRKTIWAQFIFQIARAENGQPIKFAGSAQDITQRKQAELAVRQSEEALRRQNEYLATASDVGRLITSTLDVETLYNRAVDLIRGGFGYYFVSVFILDDNGFNAIYREGTGSAGEQLKQDGLSIAVGSRSVIGQTTATLKTVIINNTALDPLFRPNVHLPETCSEAGIPLKLGDRIIGALDIEANEVDAFKPEDIAVLEILADQITIAIENARSYALSQRAVEEMRQIDQVKSQFLANMSHELRTPLNSIIGFSRVILKGIDGPINDQQKTDLSAIYNSGQHLLGLINDILDFSKIEAGKMELVFDEVEVGEIVQGVLSTAVGLVKDKPVKLKTDFDASTIPSIRADTMRFRQILLNLLSNAAKFTEEGNITVGAKVQVDLQGMDEVLISVTDTGPGISPEDQTKLFKAFSQVDSSATRKSGGTGLGLSICQRLVEMQGGRIGVHSVIGKGSTFYFTVPVFNAKPPIPETPDNGKTILCIDDDAQIISLYQRYLEPQGYTVIGLTEPLQAKAKVKELRPFAITLDIMMPERDGWSVINDLKSDIDTNHIPVIVCSIVEEADKGFSLGAADYLVKPVMEDDLVQAITGLNADGNIREVLVIDDDPNDLRLIEKVLNEHGSFKLTLAEGGKMGWDALINHPPHAVIIDLFMPDLNGFAILERLRTDERLRDIPVIVVSGVDLNSEQKKQLNQLGQQLLQKSNLNEKDLFATLDRALQRLHKKGE